MPRILVLVSIVAVMLITSLLPGVRPEALAQDATPGGDMETTQFPTIEFLGFSTGMDLASPGELTMLRLRLEPGVALPLTPDDPVGGLFVVESGVLAIETDATLAATRVAALEEALAAFNSGGNFLPEVEDNAPGALLTLQLGDSVYIPGNLSGEIRNDGSEVAVVLALLAGPAGVLSEATPAP